jgi:hypothetical protein
LYNGSREDLLVKVFQSCFANFPQSVYCEALTKKNESLGIEAIFPFLSIGFLAPEVVTLLHRIQKIMNINIVSPRAMNVLFKRIGFAIQKGVGGATCRPFISLSYVIILFL